MNPVKPVKQYCYLGITFTLNGSFKTAVTTLTGKAKRASNILRRTIDTNGLTATSLIILFDALLLPIATYAIQVWLPQTTIGKAMAVNTTDTNILDRPFRDSFEIFHLRYLKWVLQLHKQASNLVCFGDTGRCPVAIKCLPQVTAYFRRVKIISEDDESSLVGKAFQEQKNLDMDWYRTLSSIYGNSTNPAECKKSFSTKFKGEWDANRATQN